jgi:alginate O-acetyltransferase complex protein AlgI
MARARRKARVNMRATLFFMGLFLIAGLFVTAWEYVRVTGQSGAGYLSGDMKIAAGGSGQVHLPAGGGSQWFQLQVIADAPFTIRFEGMKLTGGAGANRFFSNGSARYCESPDTGSVECRIPVQKGNQDATLNFFPETQNSDLTVAYAFSLKKFKRSTATTAGMFQVALIAIAFLIPLIWLTHRSVAISQWLIISVAAGLLLYIEPKFAIVVLAFMTCIYRVALSLQRGGQGSRRALYWALAAAACFLFGFKYGGFAVLALFPDIGGLALVLPLGLSYFVIRIIDVLLRSYRGDLTVSNFRSYICYMIFPATIPAGPIMTYDGFQSGRLDRIGRDDVAYGVGRILIGLVKKLLIADLLLQRLIFHPDYGVFLKVVMDPATAEATHIITYLLLSFLFVYVDFSAYSDIAIGLGRLLGYRIDENFRWPLVVSSLRQYWQRWHMTLSNWCMRNVFMPVSMTTRSQLASTLSVFLIIGLWHDASLNWFFWGLHHGVGVAVLMYLAKLPWPKLPPVFRPVFLVAGGVATILYVSAGHSFVSLNDFQTSFQLYAGFWKSLLFLQ